VKDVSESTFESILNFLYGGKIELDEKNQEEFLKAGDSLGCKPVILSCFEYLVQTSSSGNNICQLLMDGKNGKYGKLDVDGLVSKCVKIISEEPEKVLLSKDFLKLDEEIILSIIKSSQMDVDELVIFRALHEWGMNQQKLTSKDEKEILKKLIVHVRLPLISSESLIKIVKPTNLVPFDSYLEALEYHVAPEEVKAVGIQFKERSAPVSASAFRFKWEATTGGNPTFFQLSNKDTTVKKIGGGSTWNNAMIYGDKSIKSGKVYYEIVIDHIASDKSGFAIGLSKNKSLKQKYSLDMVIGMSGYQYNLTNKNGVTVNAKERVGVLVDFTKLKVWFFQNGKVCPSVGTLIAGQEYWPAVHLYYQNDQATVSFPTSNWPKP
jgi:hypothetical protein